ncbi:MAG TPA: hypothetical protein QGF58_07270 [Myxococcota bacterium]|nr:hypothetical protein [Myxococcota bacterium]
MGTWTLFAIFLTSGCDWKDHVPGDSETPDSSAPDSEATDDSEEGGEVEAELGGHVTVQLYTAGEDGERETIDWADSTCGGVYSFGKVFVAAYTLNEEGGRRYVGQDTVDSPSTNGDDYSVDVKLETNSDVYLYAAVDYWGDRVIGSDDPVGTYPEAISLKDGDTLEDLDINILVPECYGGGGSCDTMGISGDVVITVSYAGGESAVLLVNEAGEGPMGNHVTWDNPVSTGGGAEAPYDLTICQNYGTARLIGCWDSNGNELADPLDRWGTYYTEPDVDANPVMLGSTNLTGHDIQIPLGDEAGIAVVPFVTLSGTVGMAEGSFDDLDAGAMVYVTALKYRPSNEIAVSSFDDIAYSTQSWTASELAGATEAPFGLAVPGNTITYLWAYVDSEGDGVVNGPDEPVGSAAGESSGRVPTGTSDSAGYELSLAVAAD